MRHYAYVLILLIVQFGCEEPLQRDGMFADVTRDQITGGDWKRANFDFQNLPKPEERPEFEVRLAKNPGDIYARARLLYILKPDSFRDGKIAEQVAAHFAWLIRNAPECELVSDPMASISARDPGFAEVRKAWEQVVTENSQNPKILWGATEYFVISDREFSLDCAEKGRDLEPQNPRWYDRLAQSHRLQIRGDEGSAGRREPAQRALKYLNEKIKLVEEGGGYEGPEWEIMDLSTLALLTYEAQGARAAVPLCKKIIERTATNLDRFADEFHEAHQIWGRAELALGNTKGAIDHLLVSAKVPGSPSLDSFGPDIRLCNLLIAKGERRAAVDYLKLCRKFWDVPPMPEWIKTLENGGTPDYGNYGAGLG